MTRRAYPASVNGPQQRAELAAAVARGRQNGVPWKVLCNVYNRSRSQLFRYLREIERDETSLGIDETSLCLDETS